MLLTVSSTARILESFTVDCPEWGPTELARELDISKSKAHSLLASMAEVGLLRRTPRGRYRLGFRLLGLNRVLADTTDFQHHARPVMDVLSVHFGETVHLGVLDGGRLIYVDRREGSRAARIGVSAVGARIPAHCTGVGKMLLAHLADAELDAVIDEHGLKARTRRTMTDAAVLKQALAHIRYREISFDREEALDGISCVAAPIRDADDTVVAAISIAAPTRCFTAAERRLETSVRRAAQHVTRQLRTAAHAFEPSLS